MANRVAPSSSGVPVSGSIVNLQTDSVDHAQSVGGAVYHPHEITYRERTHGFQMSLRARQLSGLTVGLLEYKSAVHLHSQPVPDSYQVNFTAFGSVAMRQGSTTVTASPKSAAIHDWTDRPNLEGWHHPARVVGIKIPREQMHNELAALLGHKDTDALRFEPGMELNSPAGQEWKHMVAHLARSLTASTPLLDNPMIDAPLTQAVVRGFLLLSHHNFSRALHGEPKAPGPRYIEAAVAFMHDHCHLPLGVKDIAEAVNVSIRSLQVGFRAHRDCTPLQSLRDIRLRKAHRELLIAHPEDTVSAIAARWGFSHPGRFAIQYAQTFGGSPSETLARSTT
jgi:AraC-like DNA-binding protein